MNLLKTEIENALVSDVKTLNELVEKVVVSISALPVTNSCENLAENVERNIYLEFVQLGEKGVKAPLESTVMNDQGNVNYDTVGDQMTTENDENLKDMQSYLILNLKLVNTILLMKILMIILLLLSFIQREMRMLTLKLSLILMLLLRHRKISLKSLLLRRIPTRGSKAALIVRTLEIFVSLMLQQRANEVDYQFKCFLYTLGWGVLY